MFPSCGNPNSLPEPDSGRTQTAQQCSHKCRPPLPTNPITSTCTGLGATVQQLEMEREEKYSRLRPNLGQLQPIPTANATVHHPNSPRSKVHPEYHQVLHQTRTHTVPPQRGYCLELLVENGFATPISKHITLTNNGGL